MSPETRYGLGHDSLCPTDTEMVRGLDIPKASPQSVAQAMRLVRRRDLHARAQESSLPPIVALNVAAGTSATPSGRRPMQGFVAPPPPRRSPLPRLPRFPGSQLSLHLCDLRLADQGFGPDLNESS